MWNLSLQIFHTCLSVSSCYFLANTYLPAKKNISVIDPVSSGNQSMYIFSAQKNMLLSSPLILRVVKFSWGFRIYLPIFFCVFWFLLRLIQASTTHVIQSDFPNVWYLEPHEDHGTISTTQDSFFSCFSGSSQVMRIIKSNRSADTAKC